MIVNYLALAVALMLSFVAAYYSIVGLAVIFSAAMIPVIIMASTLEAGKVVAASWLYRNWNNSPRFIKYYLTLAVVVLMFITSMGIFGFLSKAHLDQTLVSGDTSIELKLLDQQIQSEQRRLENAQKSLTALDRLVDQSDTESAVKLRGGQARERKALGTEIASASNAIKDLNTKALPLRKENLKIEAEVGPIKYIADLVYGDSTEGVIGKAVRAVILILVFVFDPLAIMLLLAANHSIAQSKKEIIEPVQPNKDQDGDGIVDDWFDFLHAKGSRDYGNCVKCNTAVVYADGIGHFCPNPRCDAKDTPFETEEEELNHMPSDTSFPKEKESWSPQWYKRARGLIQKKKDGIVEIKKDSIVNMK
jgi:hypothetical protein